MMIPQQSLTSVPGGKEGKRGQFQWQTKIPEDVGKPAEDADSLRYAILVRMVKVYGDPRRTLALHSIVIQSPLLKDLLEDVLSGYPGVTAKLDRLEFSGKFEPLIHRWATLKAAVEKLKDNVSKEPADERAVARVEHSEILLDLLETEFKDMIERSQDMIEQGVITHDLLWTAFHPGCLVYTKQQGQERILQLVSSRYGHDRSGSVTYCLNCQFVDFDGISFGMGKLNITVAAYEGTPPGCDIYPGH